MTEKRNYRNRFASTAKHKRRGIRELSRHETEIEIGRVDELVRAAPGI